MNIPNLIDGPPLCEGKTNCHNKGWIGSSNKWLCSDCYILWVAHVEKKRKEAQREAFT